MWCTLAIDYSSKKHGPIRKFSLKPHQKVILIKCRKIWWTTCVLRFETTWDLLDNMWVSTLLFLVTKYFSYVCWRPHLDINGHHPSARGEHYQYPFVQGNEMKSLLLIWTNKIKLKNVYIFLKDNNIAFYALQYLMIAMHLNWNTKCAAISLCALYYWFHYFHRNRFLYFYRYRFHSLSTYSYNELNTCAIDFNQNLSSNPEQ